MEPLPIFFQSLNDQLEEAIDNVPNPHTPGWAIECYQLASDALTKLKEQVLPYYFRDKNEEINFFKLQQPGLYSKFLYCQELKDFIIHLPISKTDQRKSYQKELKRISFFFKRKREFVAYYRSEATDADEKYYLRNPDNSAGDIEFSLTCDTRFCTVGSILAAQLICYERLAKHYQLQIAKLRNPDPEMELKRLLFKVLWTATKSDATELLYALYAAHAFNKGQTDVKDIADWLEGSLNLDLGNYYRTVQTLRIRKKNRTPFLDHLKSSLLRYWDEQDENPRYK